MNVLEYAYEERGKVRYTPDANKPEIDICSDEEVYYSPPYPLNIPMIYLEGLYQGDGKKFAASNKTVVMIDNHIITRYTKRNFSDLSTEEEINDIWEAYNEAKESAIWRKEKHLAETGEADLYFVTEFNLETVTKKEYLVNLHITSRMTEQDYEELIDYIDPRLIKKIAQK